MLLFFSFSNLLFSQDLQKVKELTQQAETMISEERYEEALDVLSEIKTIMAGLKGKPLQLYDLANEGIKAREVARLNREKELKYQKLVREGDDLLELGYYYEALNKYLQAYEIISKAEVEAKIKSLKVDHGKAIAAGYDRLAKDKESATEYAEALKYYEMAQELDPVGWRKSKILELKNQKEKFVLMLSDIGKKMEAHEYSAAFQLFRQAEKLFPNEDSVKIYGYKVKLIYAYYQVDSLLNINRTLQAFDKYKDFIRITIGINHEVNNKKYSNIISKAVASYTFHYNTRRLYVQLCESVADNWKGQDKMLDKDNDLYDPLWEILTPNKLKVEMLKADNGETFSMKTAIEYYFKTYLMDKDSMYISYSENAISNWISGGYEAFYGRADFRPDSSYLGDLTTLNSRVEMKMNQHNLEYVKAHLLGISENELNVIAENFEKGYMAGVKERSVKESMMLDLIDLINFRTRKTIMRQNLDDAWSLMKLNFKYLLQPYNIRYVRALKDYNRQDSKHGRRDHSLLSDFYSFNDTPFLPEIRMKRQVDEFFKLLNLHNRLYANDGETVKLEMYSPMSIGRDRSFDYLPYQYRYVTSSGGMLNDPFGAGTRSVRYSNAVRNEHMTLRYQRPFTLFNTIIPLGVDVSVNRLSASEGSYTFDQAAVRAVGSAVPGVPGNVITRIVEPYSQGYSSYRLFTMDIIPSFVVRRYFRFKVGLQRVSLRYHPAYNCPTCGTKGQLNLDQIKPVSGLEVFHPNLLGEGHGILIHFLNQSAVFHSGNNQVQRLSSKEKGGTSFLTLNPMSYTAGASWILSRNGYQFKLGVETNKVRVNYLLPNLGSNSWFRGIHRTAVSATFSSAF